MRLPHGADLPLPSYQSAHAAGLDLIAAVPAETPLTLAPGARALIPTGIAIALPDGPEAQVRPRSGLAVKHGLTVLNAPGTIDADYRGEVQVLLINSAAKRSPSRAACASPSWWSHRWPARHCTRSHPRRNRTREGRLRLYRRLKLKENLSSRRLPACILIPVLNSLRLGPSMPLVSRKGVLAIAAVVDIAIHARSRPVSAKALAARHKLPPRHLEPVLQALVRDGILKACAARTAATSSRASTSASRPKTSCAPRARGRRRPAAAGLSAGQRRRAAGAGGGRAQLLGCARRISVEDLARAPKAK